MYNTKYFERVPGRCGGRVTFIGSRVEPTYVKGCLKNQGFTREQVKEDYNLNDEQLQAAADFIELTAYDSESEEKYMRDLLSGKKDTAFGGMFPGRHK